MSNWISYSRSQAVTGLSVFFMKSDNLGVMSGIIKSSRKRASIVIAEGVRELTKPAADGKTVGER